MNRQRIEKKVIRRYSEPFKKEVVRSIEVGEQSLSSANRAYGIKANKANRAKGIGKGKGYPWAVAASGCAQALP